MTDYAARIWTCGVCGHKGPWMLTLWWRDGSGRYDVPGGSTVYVPEEPRMARACSMDCGRAFARVVGADRISITRPQSDERHQQDSIDWLKARRPQGMRAA